MLIALLKKYAKINFLRKLINFLIAGLPSFFIALPINYVLVTYFNFAKPLAYIIVLLIQVVINFFMLRRFVFKKHSTEKIYLQFIKFFSGISFFRLLDWGLYSLVVSFTSINFIFVQIANVAIFSVLKFLFSKKILEA